MNQKSSILIDFTNEELAAELKRRGCSMDVKEKTEEDAFIKSRAVDAFSKLFDDCYPSEIEYIPVKSELFETYSEFKFPSIWNEERVPSVLAIENYHDADNAPFVDVAEYYRFELYDQNGSLIAGATTIVIQTLGDFEYELEQLSEGFELVSADWSWFFRHPFFIETPKDTEAIMFIERLDVVKEYRGKGVGKWLMGVIAKHFIGHNTYGDLINDRTAIGVVPFPSRDEDGDFEKLETSLIEWYKNIFGCLQKTDDFQKTKNFVLKEEIGGSASSSILYWSAGGKKKFNR